MDLILVHNYNHTAGQKRVDISGYKAMDQWDLFVSHASEDKETVARPLASIIRRDGFTVWLDEDQLLVGDRLLERIQNGMSHSKYAAIILSRAYFAKEKKWTKEEFSTLWSLERGSKRILPILHDLTDSDLAEYCPVLLDRLYAKTDDGLSKVSRQILDALRGASCHNDVANIRFQEGKFHFHSVRYLEAMAAFEATLQIEPDYWQATVYKAMTFRRLGQIREAITLLDEIIFRLPNCEEAIYSRACYKSLLRYPLNDVLSDLQLAIRLYPPNRDHAGKDPDFDNYREEVLEALG